MDIQMLLSGKKCDCGRYHTCDIDSVYIEKGAVSRLSALCAQFKKILVVADENTFGAAGKQTCEALGKKVYGKVIFSGKSVLIPNEESIESVIDALGDSDLIVGVGSGVIQDLCKYVANEKKLHYMVVATAPSMDGYASTGAAMITGGMKVTYPAGVPKAIIADPEILAGAPMEMIKAGYGDIVGKYSALNDWKLSRAVNGEYFCQYIYDTTYEMIKKTVALADGLLQRDAESVKVLMEALVAVGIMMSFAGTSRPASGSEHHLSHFFEIVGILNGENYFAHGIDVAYSTVVTAEIREKLLKNGFPQKQYTPDRRELEEKLGKIYKSSAEGCLKLQDKVGNYAKDRAPIYLKKEKEIREILAECPSCEEIKRILALAELDIKEFYAEYGENKINEAIDYAKDLKDRYTVLWMNYDFKGKEK